MTSDINNKRLFPVAYNINTKDSADLVYKCQTIGVGRLDITTMTKRKGLRRSIKMASSHIKCWITKNTQYCTVIVLIISHVTEQRCRIQLFAYLGEAWHTIYVMILQIFHIFYWKHLRNSREREREQWQQNSCCFAHQSSHYWRRVQHVICLCD